MSKQPGRVADRKGVQSAVDTAKKKLVVLIVVGMLRFCWLGQLVWEVCFFLDGIQSRSKRKL